MSLLDIVHWMTRREQSGIKFFSFKFGGTYSVVGKGYIIASSEAEQAPITGTSAPYLATGIQPGRQWPREAQPVWTLLTRGETLLFTGC